MIHISLSFLRLALNNFITLKDPLNMVGALANPVVLSNIVDQENHLFNKTGDFVVMTLVNTEEETVGKSQLPYLKTPDDKLHVQNPDIKLNLYIQFAGFSDTTSGPQSAYERALILLDQVVFFFQYRNVFSKKHYPVLMAAGIEKLIIEPISLTFEQLNHLWATMGAKYLPSVIYKCRMLTFRETVVSPETPLIKELITDEVVN
ncbi:DUF4255 domain-containing protein [Segetibacter aerophilus]|uniref:Pvc16 N-terminal domain-containing protein n=1 Tax=Segetibacter aerophilus TaxID=670293 RepID=A0A512BIZ1_9BACT|nr:DUF4255 domain-containing protein [Segetibacter aerophilus]GEO11939.1 hypothetical protein SAE01_44350 [Segetibacter aerophilus]